MGVGSLVNSGISLFTFAIRESSICSLISTDRKRAFEYHFSYYPMEARNPFEQKQAKEKTAERKIPPGGLLSISDFILYCFLDVLSESGFPFAFSSSNLDAIKSGRGSPIIPRFSTIESPSLPQKNRTMAVLQNACKLRI